MDNCEVVNGKLSGELTVIWVIAMRAYTGRVMEETGQTGGNSDTSRWNELVVRVGDGEIYKSEIIEVPSLMAWDNSKYSWGC